jgi:hypothetical protein
VGLSPTIGVGVLDVPFTLPAAFRHPACEPVERKVSVRPGQTARMVVDLPSKAARKP